jgi:hypothetical protein
MRNTPPHNTPRSTETGFSPPAFPPKAGKAGHVVHFSKKAILGIGRGMYGFTQIILVSIVFFASSVVFVGLITLPFYLLDDFDYDRIHERSNRNIVLEDSVFLLVDENRTEIASADLLPGDRITFTHTGNITEIVHSSTSCSSSSSGSYYGESDRDSYYGGDDDMECWTDYYTHYVMDASSVMFESSSVSDIYMCHRSTCKVTGELVDADDFLIDIRSVEVIS